VPTSDRDGDGGGAKVDGSQALHIARCVALIVDTVVAELPDVVKPPALDATTFEERAGVKPASRDSDGGGAKIDGTQVSHLARVVTLVVDAVVAETPALAEPPALDAAPLEERTVVGPAGRDGDGGGAEIDGAQVSHLARCIALVIGAVVAELPVIVEPPAPDAAIGENYTSVPVATRQLSALARPRSEKLLLVGWRGR